MLISGEKMLMSAELKGCVTWFIYFLDLLRVNYNCANFHYCIYVWQVLGRGSFLPHPLPQPWAVPPKSILRHRWTDFKKKDSEMFFLDFLWWSDCYIFSSRYVFLIVTDVLRNETLCFNICFTSLFHLL